LKQVEFIDMLPQESKE